MRLYLARRPLCLRVWQAMGAPHPAATDHDRTLARTQVPQCLAAGLFQLVVLGALGSTAGLLYASLFRDLFRLEYNSQILWNMYALLRPHQQHPPRL